MYQSSRILLTLSQLELTAAGAKTMETTATSSNAADGMVVPSSSLRRRRRKKETSEDSDLSLLPNINGESEFYTAHELRNGFVPDLNLRTTPDDCNVTVVLEPRVLVWGMSHPMLALTVTRAIVMKMYCHPVVVRTSTTLPKMTWFSPMFLDMTTPTPPPSSADDGQRRGRYLHEDDYATIYDVERDGFHIVRKQ